MGKPTGSFLLGPVGSWLRQARPAVLSALSRSAFPEEAAGLTEAGGREKGDVLPYQS